MMFCMGLQQFFGSSTLTVEFAERQAALIAESNFPRSRRRKSCMPKQRKEVKGVAEQSGAESAASLDRMSSVGRSD